MVGRRIFGVASALAITFGALDASLVQSAALQPDAIEVWAHDSTVLTMAPDGAWGTATDPQVNRAIFLAISKLQGEVRQGQRHALRAAPASGPSADRSSDERVFVTRTANL